MRFAVLALAGLVALSGVAASNVLADPANDAMAKLNELSRQAEQTTEAMHSAQLDLNNKLAAQRTAEKKHNDDQAAADAAKSRLATFQTGVDKFAAAMYMGGRTDGMNAIMTAESPQQLIGKLAVQRVISTAMLTQMATYRATREEAAKAENGIGEIGRRRQDRRRAGNRGARELAVQAEPAAAADRHREVAVPGAEPARAHRVGRARARPAGRRGRARPQHLKRLAPGMGRVLPDRAPDPAPARVRSPSRPRSLASVTPTRGVAPRRADSTARAW